MSDQSHHNINILTFLYKNTKSLNEIRFQRNISWWKMIYLSKWTYIYKINTSCMVNINCDNYTHTCTRVCIHQVFNILLSQYFLLVFRLRTDVSDNIYVWNSVVWCVASSVCLLWCIVHKKKPGIFTKFELPLAQVI